MAREDEPEILTPQEAADLLRVSLFTVQRQAKAGRLPGTRRQGVALFSPRAA
jgi:excisionase family DNA binding protein